MLEGVRNHPFAGRRAARLLPFLLAAALVGLLRVNAAKLAETTGPVPFLFAVTALLAALFHFRAPAGTRQQRLCPSDSPGHIWSFS